MFLKVVELVKESQDGKQFLAKITEQNRLPTNAEIVRLEPSSNEDAINKLKEALSMTLEHSQA